MIQEGTLLNYVGGSWEQADSESVGVDNPATLDVLAQVPLSSAAAVDRAVRAAAAALPAWRRTPASRQALRCAWQATSASQPAVRRLCRCRLHQVPRRQPPHPRTLARGTDTVTGARPPPCA